MKLVGKHIVKKFDRENNLVDEQVSWNVITTKGRERILDIWAENLRPSADRDRNLYGFEIIDTSPTAVTGGTRRCTTFDVGVFLDPYDFSGTRNMNTYDSQRSYISEASSDAIFDPSNEDYTTWHGGAGGDIFFYDYWHCVDLGRVDTSETLTVDYTLGDNTHDLIGSRLKYDGNANKEKTIKVWNATKTASYTVNTDFTYDEVNGRVTFLELGTIPDAVNVVVDYIWHDMTPFQDGVCGWYMNALPRGDYGALDHNSFMSGGRFSHTMGESWNERCWPWEGRPNEHHTQRYTEGDNWWQDGVFNPRYAGNNHIMYWLTYPWIMNNPTNFAFQMNLERSPLYIRNWNFIKPKYQPQTPSVIALGTGSTAAAVGDTSLESESFRFDVFSGTRPSNGLGKWKAFIDYDEASGVTFNEVGLFYGDTWKDSEESGWTFMCPIKKENCTGLFSRSVYGSPWSKTDNERVELTYEILIT